jgi:hypothetical protein
MAVLSGVTAVMRIRWTLDQLATRPPPSAPAHNGLRPANVVRVASNTNGRALFRAER